MGDTISTRTLNGALRSYALWCLGVAAVLLLPWWGSWAYSPLATWVRWAMHSDDASHVLLELPIVAYLVWVKWRELPAPTQGRFVAPVLAGVSAVILFLGMGSAAIDTDEIVAPYKLAVRLRESSDPVSAAVAARLSSGAQLALAKHAQKAIGPNDLRRALVDDLNALVTGPPLYDPLRFREVKLRESTRALLEQAPQGEDLAWLNRRLLEDTFPQELHRAGWLIGDAVPPRFGVPCTAITLSLGSNARPFLTGVAMVLGLLAGAWKSFGPSVLRVLRFPVFFLVFAVPIPDVGLVPINAFLQFWTAEASYWMLRLTGVELPVPVENTLHIRGVGPLVVAEECSGIRSTMVLVMVALLGAHLLLRQPWRRGLLILLSVPIGILRNGLRVWTLAILALKYDLPVNSPENLFHKHGGQPMFLVSLIPLFALLLWLRRGERKKAAASVEPSPSSDRNS